MGNFVDWLSHNQAASATIIVAFSLMVVTLIVIYAVAFFQGRAVSFWPPKIGPKPAFPAKPSPAEAQDLDLHIPLTLGKGAILVSASGERYVLGARINSGSTAGLFEAQSKLLQKAVAKVYWVGPEPNSPIWEHFNREIKASELLQHRNIVRVFDRGIAGGYPFLVMEYLGGGTLHEWIAAHDRLPGSSILSIGTQVADAIDYAHSQGVIHRDLKPGNILFESDATGRVAVSDFGIARLLGASRRALTAEDSIVGTIDYLSPEAIRGQKLTTSTDIYAFGVLLFEMITGSTPFSDDSSPSAVIYRILSEEAPDIRKFRLVSKQLSDRIRITLSSDPQERPISARNVLAGMENDLLNL
jgi:serine/threonine protein kinase